MNKLLKLTDRYHTYCIDYLESCEKFVHENKDVITNVVNVACGTVIVKVISEAAVDIVRVINKNK